MRRKRLSLGDSIGAALDAAMEANRYGGAPNFGELYAGFLVGLWWWLTGVPQEGPQRRRDRIAVRRERRADRTQRDAAAREKAAHRKRRSAS